MFPVQKYYNRDSYYTYEQVKQISDRVASIDLSNVGFEDYPQWDFKTHISKLIARMDNYNIDKIGSREVIPYTKWEELVLGLFDIYPYEFIILRTDNYTCENTAPNFRLAKCCSNCKHFNELTDYDEMRHGECKKHSSTSYITNPPLKDALDLDCDSVCDDFEMNDNEYKE